MTCSPECCERAECSSSQLERSLRDACGAVARVGSGTSLQYSLNYPQEPVP